MIRLVRLVTGEDVVSEIQKKEGVVVFKNPHRLVLTKEGLGSMPLCPFCKDEVYEIAASNVLFDAEPQDEIRDSYAAQVGSIVVPPSGIIRP
jgi:hypothetical protein